MNRAADIRRQFGITKLQWTRAANKAAKRVRNGDPALGHVLMSYLTQLCGMPVDQAFDEIERVTGERPAHSPTPIEQTKSLAFVRASDDQRSKAK